MSSKHLQTKEIQKRKANITLRPRKRRFQTYKRVSLGNWVETNITQPNPTQPYFSSLSLFPPSCVYIQCQNLNYTTPQTTSSFQNPTTKALFLCSIFGRACFLPFLKGLFSPSNRLIFFTLLHFQNIYVIKPLCGVVLFSFGPSLILQISPPFS